MNDGRVIEEVLIWPADLSVCGRVKLQNNGRARSAAPARSRGRILAEQSTDGRASPDLECNSGGTATVYIKAPRVNTKFKVFPQDISTR